MQVDIYVCEKDGSREIRFPILPEEFSFHFGDTMFIGYEIINRGAVAVPSGTELSTYSWESVFPGVLSPDSSLRGRYTPASPQTYCSLLSEWMSKGTVLNLLITGYPVNVDVYCSKFLPKGEGPFGDIAYEIQFTEARSITVVTDKAQANTTVTVRPTPPNNKSYTIKRGDTLWSISQKHYGTGTKWKTIYDANSKIIEETAKARGRQSSQNGHWIYPGVVLTIPDAG